jgi:uncharacterized membrane protein YcaP (DUF421 family)
MLHLLVPDVTIAEKVVRSVVIYVFFLLVFRVMGKRQVGQLTPFDLVLLLIISNVVQNAAIGNDNSLGGGLIGAVAILVVNSVFVEATYRSKRLRHLLEPYPTILIHDGRILDEHLRRERLTLDDLKAALRRNGVVEASDVHFAVLEGNGGISVIPYPSRSRPDVAMGPTAPSSP